MAFTLGKFVRHTPAPALRSYFHRTNVDFGRAVDWTKGERTLAKALTIAIGRLPDVIREGVYADFERIDELADEIGEQAIISAFPDPAVAIELFEGMQGAHERCLWVLLNHDEVFRRAEEVRFSTHHRLSRMWDGFIGPRGQSIDQSDRALAVFKGGLQRLFQRRDGSGRSIVVEIFCRWSDADDDARDQLTQITAYLEGMPASAFEFDQGKLDRRVQRPAFELALTYDRKTGAIDVIAKGGKLVRADIARIFLVTLLGVSKEQLEAIPLRQYDLSLLQRPHRFWTEPQDGIKSVEVVRLRLRPYSGEKGHVTIEGRRGARSSIYDQAHDWFGSRNPLRSGFTVEHARLAITFHPAPGAKRGKTLYVELTTPNSCNLKDRTEHERLIGEKYLAEWGLLKALGRGARSA